MSFSHDIVSAENIYTPVLTPKFNYLKISHQNHFGFG